MLFVLRSS